MSKSKEDPSFWSNINFSIFGLDEYRTHMQKLKNQKYSVQNIQVNFPVIEDKKEGFQDNLNEIDTSSYQLNEISTSNVDKLASSIREIEAVTQSVPNQLLDNFIEKDIIFNIQLKANDLKNSAKNLENQRKSLEDFKNKSEEIKAELNLCPQNMASLIQSFKASQNDFDILIEQEKEKVNRIKEIEETIRQKSEEGRNSQALLKIGELEQELKALNQ